MPKLRGPLLSLGATGGLTKLFSLARRMGRNIIEKKPIPVDAKSPAQLFYRDRFTDCVAEWHLLSEAQKKEWERQAQHMTSYAAFMRYCLSLPPVVPTEVTFYPDAHPEATSVDGFAEDFTANQLWALLIAQNGSAGHHDEFYLSVVISADASTDEWDVLQRIIILFDTSSLPDDCTIIDAKLYLYGYAKLDDLGIAPSYNVYASNPASNITIISNDYTCLGDTPLCDAPLAYADWAMGTPGSPNIFTLNTAGLAAISKTGITKLGLREIIYDVGASTPTWTANLNSYIAVWSADKGGDYRPKLVITYV